MGYVWLRLGYVVKVTILLLFISWLRVRLRGYVIFENKKKYFFTFKKKFYTELTLID